MWGLLRGEGVARGPRRHVYTVLHVEHLVWSNQARVSDALDVDVLMPTVWVGRVCFPGPFFQLSSSSRAVSKPVDIFAIAA